MTRVTFSGPDFRFWRRRRTPVLVSGQASECGLVCMTMIAAYWGHHVDLPGMRSLFSVSIKGATFRGLMNMAGGLRLHSRPLKAPLDALREVRLPCVLHWDLNHFVVLTAITRRKATIHDPAVGARLISIEELSKHYTGAALELWPTHEFKRIEARQPYSFQDLVGRVAGLRSSLGQLLLLGIALQIVTMAAPFFLQWVIDEAVLSADRALLTVLGCGFMLLVFLQTAISAVRSWALAALSANFNFQWLGNTFSHLLKLPLTYFERRHLGDIVSRFNSIRTIQQAVTTQFVEGVIDGLLALGTLGMMFLYSPMLALISVSVVALYVTVRSLMVRPNLEALGRRILYEAKQQTNFLESARGILSIRVFGTTNERRSSWLNLLADQINAEVSSARLGVAASTLQTFVFSAERIVVVWLAALAVMDSHFSVGMLFAFLAYKEQFTARITALADKLLELRLLTLHADRVADIVLTRPEEPEVAPEVDVEDIEPSVELRNVSFRYSDQEPFVLRGLNLKVAAGEHLAITGISGSGKTTLLKILLGLLKPTEGEVLVGGRPLAQLGLSNYRKLVGVVMQDDHLFSGSIMENISFFDTVGTLESVVQAARTAAIDAEIRAMPMSYQTILGSGSSGLSGGQRQRILLARALYVQPKILVLDEATSHLDVANEKLVNSAVKEYAVTRIVVAHRPETLRMSGRVVLLERGEFARDMLVTKQHGQDGDLVSSGRGPTSESANHGLTHSVF